MFAYDKTFDPKVVLGHFDLNSVILPYISALNWYMNILLFFHDMFAYDKTFEVKYS